MILKGTSRGSGQRLATQLLNADNNRRVEILEMRGSVARDLHGAFEEWCACSMATQCRKYLYSLSINPDPRQGGLARAQYFDLMRSWSVFKGPRTLPPGEGRGELCERRKGKGVRKTAPLILYPTPKD